LITTRPSSGEKQINVGGKNRKYNLYVPNSYPTNKRVPLVLRFHGLGGNGGGEINSGYKSIADSEGFILVAPTGASGPAGNAWNVGPCCTSDKNVDDVAFVRAIIKEVKKVANIDDKRIYATGFSMGGGMTHYLACHASDVIAAFAPEAFDLLQENVNQCNPSRAVPLLSQRASNDGLVKYNGGQDCLTGTCINFLGAVKTNDTWKQKSSCTNQTNQDGQCSISTQCSDGVEVGLCTNNIGHAPANAQLGWNFMKRFTLP
jgi:poly(hydroxyalkanoate) depolymerase family esterase